MDRSGNVVRVWFRGCFRGLTVQLDDHDIAIARSLIALACLMLLIATVFRLGASIGYRAASDDLQYDMERARRARSEPERAPGPKPRRWSHRALRRSRHTCCRPQSLEVF